MTRYELAVPSDVSRYYDPPDEDSHDRVRSSHSQIEVTCAVSSQILISGIHYGITILRGAAAIFLQA